MGGVSTLYRVAVVVAPIEEAHHRHLSSCIDQIRTLRDIPHNHVMSTPRVPSIRRFAVADHFSVPYSPKPSLADLYQAT